MAEACENLILAHLASAEDAMISDTFEWSAANGIDHNDVVGAMKSLMVEDYVQSSDLVTAFYVLSPEAEDILVNGSQEVIVLTALLSNDDGLSVAELQAKVGGEVCKIGMGNCLKNKWAKKDGDRIVATKALDEVVDDVKVSLQTLVNEKCKMEALGDKVSPCRDILLRVSPKSTILFLPLFVILYFASSGNFWSEKEKISDSSN